MTEKRGWCPSLFNPMPSGDGLLVRVKPPGMRLSADAATALADAADRYGSGTIELTCRANLQIRGLSLQTAPAFAAAMTAAGLASADPESERRRMVMCSPLAGDDPTLASETLGIAAAIERALIEEPCFAALPDKFRVVVDGGGVLPLDDVPADIRVHAGPGGFRIAADVGEIVAGNAAAAAARALGFARLSLRQAERPPRRQGSNREPREKAGLLPPAYAGLARNDRRRAEAIGFIRYPRLAAGTFGLGAAFGATSALALTDAARLARKFGDGLLRTTPWRTLLIGGIAQADATALLVAARGAGFIVEPSDQRRRVSACVGAPGCVSAAVPARADAALLAATLANSAATIHVSGCRKGCARHGAADVVLIGERGRYALVRNGGAADQPVAVGLSIAEAAAWLRRESRT